MKLGFYLLVMCLGLGQGLFAQRKLHPKSREQKKLEKQVNRKQYKDNDPDERITELFKGDRRFMENR